MPTRPPPEIPSTIDQQTAQYLRSLSLWAYQQIDSKIPKDEATPNLILAAYDTKLNPHVFRIQVTNSGTLQANPVVFGEGKP